MVQKIKKTRSRYDTRFGLNRAFTVVELMVVIVIGLVILTIAVPAFQAMAYSSNRSLAANALKASSKMARDLAIRSGVDSAVVFVYDPQIGKMQIIPAIKIGVIREPTTAGTGTGMSMQLGDLPYFDRAVFVPAPAGEVLELPEFWMVRGHAPSRTLLDRDSAGDLGADWYNWQAYGGDDELSFIKDTDHWLFPETGFFPYNAQVNGGAIDGGLDAINPALPTARQSFMLLFDARTGVVSRDTNAALFVDPRNSRERPYGDTPTLYERTLRVDLTEDIAVWASRIVDSPDLTDDGIAYGFDDGELRLQLIGTASNDTILVKPVTRLALYDERELAIGVLARGLNQVTQTIYLPADQDDPNAKIEFDDALFAIFNEADLIEQIDFWIDGNTTFARDGDTEFDLDDEPGSRIFMVQSYTGELQEVLR